MLKLDLYKFKLVHKIYETCVKNIDFYLAISFKNFLM